MPSNKRNKTIASVRVWKRGDRAARWYCTVRIPGQKPRVRSCRRHHRASAEEFAGLLLKELIRGAPPQRTATAVQPELPPPDTIAVTTE